MPTVTDCEHRLTDVNLASDDAACSLTTLNTMWRWSWVGVAREEDGGGFRFGVGKSLLSGLFSKSFGRPSLSISIGGNGCIGFRGVPRYWRRANLEGAPMKEFLTYFRGIPQYVFFTSLILAFATMVALESHRAPESRRTKFLMFLFLFFCYSACVGIMATLLVGLLGINPWVALLTALILGALLLLLLMFGVG